MDDVYGNDRIFTLIILTIVDKSKLAERQGHEPEDIRYVSTMKVAGPLYGSKK